MSPPPCTSASSSEPPRLHGPTASPLGLCLPSTQHVACSSLGAECLKMPEPSPRPPEEGEGAVPPQTSHMSWVVPQGTWVPGEVWKKSCFPKPWCQCECWVAAPTPCTTIPPKLLHPPLGPLDVLCLGSWVVVPLHPGPLHREPSLPGPGPCPPLKLARPPPRHQMPHP